LVEVARVDVPALGQARRHRERRVAAIGAELEHPLRAEPEYEQLEEAPFDRPGQHLRSAEIRARFVRELLQQLEWRRRMRGSVRLDLVWDDHRRGASVSLPSLIRCAMSFDSSR